MVWKLNLQVWFSAGWHGALLTCACAVQTALTVRHTLLVRSVVSFASFTKMGICIATLSMPSLEAETALLVLSALGFGGESVFSSHALHTQANPEVRARDDEQCIAAIYSTWGYVVNLGRCFVSAI